MCLSSSTKCEDAATDAPASLSPHPISHSHGNDTPANTPPTSTSTALTTMSQSRQLEKLDRKHRMILDGLLRRSYHAGYADALASGKALASVQAEDAAIAAVLAPLEGANPGANVASDAARTNTPVAQTRSSFGTCEVPTPIIGLVVVAATAYAYRRARRPRPYEQVRQQLDAAGKKPDLRTHMRAHELSELPSVPVWMSAPPVPKTWVQASRRMREHENDPEVQKLNWAEKSLVKSVVLQGGLDHIPADHRQLKTTRRPGSAIGHSDHQSPLRAIIPRTSLPGEPAEDLSEDPADADAAIEIWRLREQLREAQEALEVLKKVGVERGVERTHAPGSAPVDGKAVAEAIRQAVDKVEGAERVGASVDAYAESAPSAADVVSAATPSAATPSAATPTLSAEQPKQSLRAMLNSKELAEDAKTFDKASRQSNAVAHSTTVDPTPEAHSSPTPCHTTGPESMPTRPDGQSQLKSFLRASQATSSYPMPPLTPQVPVGEEVMSMEALRKAVEDIKASHEPDNDDGASVATSTPEATPAPPSLPKTDETGLGVGVMATRPDRTPLREPFLRAPQATPSFPMAPVTPQVPLGEEVMSMEALRKAVEDIKASYALDSDGGASAATPTSEATPTPPPPSPPKTGDTGHGFDAMSTGTDGRARLRPFLRAAPSTPSMPPLTPQVPPGEDVMSMEALHRAVDNVKKGYVEDENKKKAPKGKQGKAAKAEEAPKPAHEATNPSGEFKLAAFASKITTATTTTSPVGESATIEVRLAKSSRYYFYLRPSFFTPPASIPPARGSIAYEHVPAPVYGPEVVEQVTVIKRCAPEDVARGVWEDLQRAGLKVPGKQAKGRVSSIDDVFVWELDLPIRPTSDGSRALVKIDGQWWESRVVKKLKGMGTSGDAVWLWTMGK